MSNPPKRIWVDTVPISMAVDGVCFASRVKDQHCKPYIHIDEAAPEELIARVHKCAEIDRTEWEDFEDVEPGNIPWVTQMIQDLDQHFTQLREGKGS